MRSGRTSPTSELLELISLPVIIASLSLAMWFSLPTGPEVVEAYGARLDARRGAVIRAADLAAARHAARESRCSAPLTPSPFYSSASTLWSKHRDSSAARDNTEILGEDELQGFGWSGTLELDQDLYLSDGLSTMLRWRHERTGPPGRKSPKRLGEEIERLLGLKYLVIYRTRSIVPVSRDSTGLARGRLRVEAYLFDLDRNDLACELAFDEDLDPTFQAEEFEEFARSRLYEQSRDRLLAELARITGGTFALRDPFSL